MGVEYACLLFFFAVGKDGKQLKTSMKSPWKEGVEYQEFVGRKFVVLLRATPDRTSIPMPCKLLLCSPRWCTNMEPQKNDGMFVVVVFFLSQGPLFRLHVTFQGRTIFRGQTNPEKQIEIGFAFWLYPPSN